jgi:hypothetical protein
MAKVKRTKQNHRNRYLQIQKIPEKSLLPGMILEFSYNISTVYDRKPLIFFMHLDKTNQTIEGVNLNYLKDSEIQKFFTNVKKRIVPIYYENLIRLKEPYIRVQVNSRLRVEAFDSQTIYKVIFPMDHKIKKSYRSYKLQNASSMKIINYDLEVLEGEKPTLRGEVLKGYEDKL